MNQLTISLILIFFMSVGSLFILNINYANGDWNRHIELSQGEETSYPSLIYLLYPSFELTKIYMFLIIPILLLTLSYLMKNYNYLAVTIVYYFSQVSFHMINFGFLKQIIFTMFLLIFLILIESKFNIKLKLTTLFITGGILYYLEPIGRLLPALFNFQLNNVTNGIPAASIPGLYLIIPFILSSLFLKRYLYLAFFIIAGLMGIYESRIFATLFIIGIPLFVLTVTEQFLSLKRRFAYGSSSS